MDPQTPNPMPAPSPTPPAPSSPFGRPATSPAPAAPPAPGWQAPAPAMAPKSSKGLLIGIICAIAVVVLGVLGIAAYMFIFSSSAQAKNTSTLFMHYITAGDTTKAAAYSAATPNELSAYVASVKGSSSLSQSTFQRNTGYYLYNLQAKYKYARTTVQRSGSRWLVVSFVIANNPLKLIPGATASTQTTPSSTTTTSTTCLAPADYDGILQDINGTTTTNTFVYTADVPFIQNVHFNADSLDFIDPAQTQQSIVTAFAHFYSYKTNSSKQFKIHLYGSVATTGQSDLSFANQRATKVQSLLEAAGVPSSYISIDSPQNINSAAGDTSNATDQASSRVVVLSIVPDASCSSSTGQ